MAGTRLVAPRPIVTPLQLTVDKIVSGGDGLARQPEGPVVFVPRSAPGERVEVEIVEERRQWLRGRLRRVVQPSPDRRDPPCPIYDVCSGCQLQHLDYAAQLNVKSGIVADTLRRLGDLALEPPPVVPSPDPLGYRNRITLTLRRLDDGVIAGYHRFEAPDELVDVERCPLAERALNAAWSELRAVWGVNASKLPEGEELRLTLRATKEGRIGLAIEGGEGYGDVEALFAGVSDLDSIWFLGADGAIEWYAGEPRLWERWGEHELGLAGLSFVQVNRQVGPALESYVRKRCGDVTGRRVIDAYCGFGTRTLALAWSGARAVGIDADLEAVEGAQVEAVESGASARFVVAPVEEALPEELPADIVILNPPRRGLRKPAVAALNREPPDRIIYVSCDPATLARDLESLARRFRLTDCRAFDMFPQTARVETVASLERRET